MHINYLLLQKYCLPAIIESKITQSVNPSSPPPSSMTSFKYNNLFTVNIQIPASVGYLGSAFRCRWTFKCHMMDCLGRNREMARDRSCHACRKTVVMGFNLPSDRSDTELVGEVGVVWHRYHECLPHSSKFCRGHKKPNIFTRVMKYAY